MSYEHGFVKKHDGHKLFAKVEFRSVFRALSRKFNKLAIPNVIAHWKSYEHGFVKKLDGHKLCKKSRAYSSFDRFSCTVEIQNTWHSRRINQREVV
ncbi:hypothetical protein GW17_00059342 [Ensete ventricosum]|nr:hypothetical protein GW17_00059342 [Ensete ventricosum]